MGEDQLFFNRGEKTNKNMETTGLNKDNDALDDTLELLKETARLFYQNTDQNVTINLYFALGGVILALGALHFMWNFLPDAFNAMLSSLKPVGGGGYGHGHGHHLSRNGNKYNSGGLASYDEYDYNYSAAAEHYEATEELADIIRTDSDTRRSDMSTDASHYSGSFIKPGSHLVQRQIN